MIELGSWRSIASSTRNSGAIGVPEKDKPRLFLWGSNSTCLIPYLPDTLELDTPHEVNLDKIFTGDLALPGYYRIVDMQLTENLCYFLIEEYLPKNLFQDLKKKRKHLEQFAPAVGLYDTRSSIF
jgi:hypothetical protein